MRAMFLHLETDFPIQITQEHIVWAISYQARKHA
jgi:hypothetical protein